MKAGGWSVVAVLCVTSGCHRSTSPTSPAGDASIAAPPTPTPTPTVESAPPPPATWTKISFVSEAGPDDEPLATEDVYPDGRVVFGFVRFDVPSVARAPNKLLADIEEWAKAPLPPGEPLDASAPDAGFGAIERYDVRVTIVRAGKTHEARYPTDALPPSVGPVSKAVDALINSPRRPVPCAKWDGKGEFSLAFQSQDFGVAPGPVDRTTIKSDGTIARASAGGARDARLTDVKRATASPAEIDAVRAAIVAQDLGRYGDVFGGAGEGSNFRSVTLTTATAGSCARAFTNEYPADMKPLFAATAPLTSRVTQPSN